MYPFQSPSSAKTTSTMATAAAGTDRLGQHLISEGLITREQLAQALAEQRQSKHRLGYVLVKLGLVQEIEITKLLARQARMPAVDLSRFEVDPRLLKLVPSAEQELLDELERRMHPTDFDELMEINAPRLLAQALGLEHCEWLAYDYIATDGLDDHPDATEVT